MKKNYFEQVYDVVAKIPYGKVATYGQVARLTGRPRNARQVGFALHVNPNPKKIPCHRVVNRFGKVSSGFAFGGEEIHKQLLLDEGIKFDPNNCINLQKYQWQNF